MQLALFVLVFYSTLCGTLCSPLPSPSRPLNDRPSESWQAWLLVDSQNEGDRRITPKSVFIAPNIGDASNLPDCAEGYRSDPMGRCVKFVKVDEAAHLDFLLQRLNALYATRNSQDFDDDVKPTTGPLQVNIPLEDNEDPEIAIIVAPTNGQFDQKEIDKRTQEETTTEDITTTTVETTTDNLQALFFLNKTEDLTTTTEQEETTSISTTPENQQLSSSEIELLFKEYISQKPYDQIQIPRPVYNHRNRDKNDFWRPVEPQKPLVLRFNRPYSEEQSEELYGDVFERKRRRFR